MVGEPFAGSSRLQVPIYQATKATTLSKLNGSNIHGVWLLSGIKETNILKEVDRNTLAISYQLSES